MEYSGLWELLSKRYDELKNNSLGPSRYLNFRVHEKN